jgi:hypothetical protein
MVGSLCSLYFLRPQLNIGVRWPITIDSSRVVIHVPPWLAALVPFLKGALGWSAASFVYENVVKASRSKRQLARVLAEEVSLALQAVVYHGEMAELRPKTVPEDFRLHGDVYQALLSRVGELPDHIVGELLLFHQRCAVLNEDTRRMLDAVERLERIKRDPDRNGGLEALDATREGLRRGLMVWRGHFPVLAEQGNRLLRNLRIAETPLGRVGYLFRRKPTLDVAQVRENVAARVKQLEADQPPS